MNLDFGLIRYEKGGRHRLIYNKFLSEHGTFTVHFILHSFPNNSSVCVIDVFWSSKIIGQSEIRMRGMQFYIKSFRLISD